ncbi:MAG: TIGR01620 family protein [Cobetia sp.]|jgi:putative membrane protein|uniref:TIGR01620 family protein n=1 Tax=Cobetia sp. TaxID=1873876 RepID=UPI000C51409A|nr:TIGR01620 family protein [Cobetia sp.]MBK10286.1 TIGR01620 family protein [Cobetia sp.]HBJ26993.1 TIGR01620 family protein [Cobetia sp.]|tara:strand:+ start:44570 stop:45778 length:1209 start_codon:yes stop_codon:yes gene_type:complete
MTTESRHPRPGKRFTSPDSSDSADSAQADAASTTYAERSTESASERAAEALRGARHFSPEMESQPLAAAEPEPATPGLDATLSARPRHRGLKWLLLGTLTLGGGEAGHALYQAAMGGDLIAGAWGLLGLGAIGLGARALGKELFRLRHLRKHVALRAELEEHQQDDFGQENFGQKGFGQRGDALATPDEDAGKAGGKADSQQEDLLEQLRRQMKLGDDDAGVRAWRAACEAHHSPSERRELFAFHVLGPRDREARRLISRMSGETAVMVAVSPLTWVDMSLVAWRGLRMMERLSRLYGLELGYASRLRLFKEVLASMAFAGASELAAEASMDLLSMNLAGRLSTKAGQGLGSGLMNARLGLRAMRLLRPIPFHAEEVPRIGELRAELFSRMRKADKGEDDAS